MTAYHVVSGELDESKKIALGFGRHDKLEVKVFTNGCQAKVLKVDQDADLAQFKFALRRSKPPRRFKTTLNKNEDLMLVADRTAIGSSVTGPSTVLILLRASITGR